MRENYLSTDLLSRVTEGLLLLGLILAPLAVIPIFTNFLITSKLLLLFLSAIVLGGLFIWRTFKEHTIEVPHSPLVVGLTVFGVSALLSSILTTQYPLENLLGMGGMYIALAVIAVTGGQFLRTRNDISFMHVLNVSAALLAVASIAQHFGYGPANLLNQLVPLNIPAGNAFNLTGSLWVAGQLFAVVLIANIVSVVVKRSINWVQLLTVPLVAIGLAFAIWGVLPGQPTSPVLVPYSLSWSVAIDSLKIPRVALVGFGPEHYTDAFQMMKPASVNGTAFWNSTLGQGANLPFTLLPTVGLVGLGAWLFIAAKIVGQTPVAIRRHPGLMAVVLGTLVLQILTTPTLVLSWIQAIALAYLIASRENGTPKIIHLLKITSLDPSTHQDRKHLASFLSWGLPIVLAVIAAVSLLWPLSQAYAASHYFFRGLLAQQANDLNGMYTNQQLAARTNRYISGYRSNFALTSLVGARALASNQETAQANQQQILALIQQAINEGRAAAALRPQDSQTWYTLGQIYGAIAGTTPDALQWAVAAYTQAIQTNPTNPLLRIELGTLLYGQKQYEDAAVLFQQAYQLKPDLTTAAYNLATTYRQLGQYQKAQAAYQAALSTLPTDSQEYATIKDELDSLPAQAQDQQAEQATPQSNSQSPTASASSSARPSATQQNINQTNQAVVEEPAAQSLPELNAETPPSNPDASPAP